MNEINILGKEYTKRETTLKIIRSLPEKWDVFTVIFQNTKDLNEVSTQQLFSELKAFEFDLNKRKAVKTPNKVKNDESHKNVPLKAKESESSKPAPNTLLHAEMLEEMNLMARRFDRLNSRFGKYKRFYQDAKDRKRYTKSSGYTKRSEDKYPDEKKKHDGKRDSKYTNKGEASTSKKDKKKAKEKEEEEEEEEEEGSQQMLPMQQDWSLSV
ncbi:hypothetical protein ACS0TY_032558 [Phlomoides rotata]